MNKIILSSALLLMPAVSFAQVSFLNNVNFYKSNTTITEIIFIFIDIINQAVVVVVALALLFFFWGLAKFIMNSDNEDKRKESKSHMVWGIVALFVMLFVWQIINILANTFFYY